MNNNPSPIRLPKKHDPGANRNTTASQGERLVALQSFRNAIVASLIVVILFSVFWVALSTLTNRIFPWITLLLGIGLGFAVRRAGRGVDWRFPLIAAAMTLVGSLLANIVVAAATTAETFGIGTFQVLRATTSMTWPVFFDEVLSVADVVYAVFAASLAAFFANRRLSRSQYLALRLWREESSSNGHQ